MEQLAESSQTVASLSAAHTVAPVATNCRGVQQRCTVLWNRYPSRADWGCDGAWTLATVAKQIRPPISAVNQVG
jgi:hypothetical protein